MPTRARTIISLFVCSVLLAGCSAQASGKQLYTAEKGNTLQQSDDILAIYTNIDDRDTGNNIIHVNAALQGGKTKELFKFKNCEAFYEQPILVYDRNAIYVLLSNDSFSETEVFSGDGAPDPQSLNCGFRSDPNPRLFKYDYSSGEIEEIKVEKPNTTLLLDGVVYQNSLIYIAELRKRTDKLSGAWLDSTCIVSGKPGELGFKIVGNSPLKIKSCLLGNDIYFPALSGIYRYDLSTGAVAQCLAAKYNRCDYVRITPWDGGFIIISETTEPYTYKLERKAEAKIEKYDKNFHLVSSAAIQGTLDYCTTGTAGAVTGSLAKSEDGFVIKSSYIDFNNLSTSPIGDYLLDYDIFCKYYKSTSSDDKMDRETYLNNYMPDFDITAPAWHYNAKLKQYLFIEPHTGEVLNRFTEPQK